MLPRGLAGGGDGQGAPLPVRDSQEGGAPHARRALARVGEFFRGFCHGGEGVGAADEPAADAGGLRAAGAADTDEASHLPLIIQPSTMWGVPSFAMFCSVSVVPVTNLAA